MHWRGLDCYEIRCIGEGFVSNLVGLIQIDIIHTAKRNMASGSGSGSDGGGGDCNRLHRPGGVEFECVRKREWEELVEEVTELVWQLELLEEVEEGGEAAVEEWTEREWLANRNWVASGPREVDASSLPAAQLTARLIELRRRLFDRVTRRAVGDDQ